MRVICVIPDHQQLFDNGSGIVRRGYLRILDGLRDAIHNLSPWATFSLSLGERELHSAARIAPAGPAFTPRRLRCFPPHEPPRCRSRRKEAQTGPRARSPCYQSLLTSAPTRLRGGKARNQFSGKSLPKGEGSSRDPSRGADDGRNSTRIGGICLAGEFLTCLLFSNLQKEFLKRVRG